MKITDETRRILEPLSVHKAQYMNYKQTGEDDGPVIRHIGSFGTTDVTEPVVSHDTYVAEDVLPYLEGACNRFGQEEVARAIVRQVSRIYSEEPKFQGKTMQNYNKSGPYCGDSSAFLASVLRSCPDLRDDDDVVDSVYCNVALANQLGIDYVFGPMVDLYLTHAETRVFSSTCKFLHHHAKRMGYVIADFSEDDYKAYIAACQLLLQHNTYDWVLEHNPEEWGEMRPIIRKYGMAAVLKTMTDVYIATSHLEGTKNAKYKYSFMRKAVDAIMRFVLPKVREDGLYRAEEALGLLLDRVFDLASHGAFTKPRWIMGYRNVDFAYFLDLSKCIRAAETFEDVKRVIKGFEPNPSVFVPYSDN